MAETMDQTLENQERYEDQGPCFYWYPGEDEDYEFYWNGVYGDPIQVESTTSEGVVDLIPTQMLGLAPKETPNIHLGFFELMAQAFLKKKKGSNVILLETEGEEPMTMVMHEDNSISFAEEPRKSSAFDPRPEGNVYDVTQLEPAIPEETTDDSYTKTKPSQHDSGPDLTRFFPEEESPR